MFNYYIYDRKAKKKDEVEFLKKKFVKDQNRHKTANDKLATMYKKRVENFILSVS